LGQLFEKNKLFNRYLATLLDYFSVKKLQIMFITVEELLARYQNGERNFAGISLASPTGITQMLTDADLTGINLSGADLTGLRLERVNLSEAILTRSNFLDSVLIDVNLNHAELYKVNLRRCQGLYVDLSLAFMVQSNWVKTKILYSNLFYTNLEEAILICSSLEGAMNTDPFRIGGAFAWHLTLPDGSLDEGPRFIDYPD
jgi:uncharacterized protein YjbI with pentapeptide repeats